MNKLAIALCVFAFPVFAGEAKNVTVEDRYTTVLERVPRTKQECVNVDVPVYGEYRRSATGGDVLGGMIIGGLLGKGITGKDNGAAAGAILGGVIAADSGNRVERQIVGYRKEHRCDEVVYYENIERTVYSHSIIRWEVDGVEYATTFEK